MVKTISEEHLSPKGKKKGTLPARRCPGRQLAAARPYPGWRSRGGGPGPSSPSRCGSQLARSATAALAACRHPSRQWRRTHPLPTTDDMEVILSERQELRVQVQVRGLTPGRHVSRLDYVVVRQAQTTSPSASDVRAASAHPHPV